MYKKKEAGLKCSAKRMDGVMTNGMKELLALARIRDLATITLRDIYDGIGRSAQSVPSGM